MWTTLKISGVLVVVVTGLSACLPQQSSGPGSGLFGGAGNSQPAPDLSDDGDGDGDGGGSESPGL